MWFIQIIYTVILPFFLGVGDVEMTDKASIFINWKGYLYRSLGMAERLAFVCKSRGSSSWPSSSKSSKSSSPSSSLGLVPSRFPQKVDEPMGKWRLICSKSKQLVKLQVFLHHFWIFLPRATQHATVESLLQSQGVCAQLQDACRQPGGNLGLLTLLMPTPDW